MKRNQIEEWTRQVIDRVEQGQPNEDSAVELKTIFIEPSKAADRIAAHANAAQGEPILWIIGVDEKNGVIGVQSEDLATWWPQVKKDFEGGVTPDLTDVNIFYGNKTVVALYLLTDRAPFVIKRGEVSKVLWREGTQALHATRAQLLRLLSPLQKLPDIEILGASFNIGPKDQFSSIHPLWASIKMYITMPRQERGYIPHHKCKVIARNANESYVMEEINFSTNVHIDSPGCTAMATQDHLIITGAGIVTITAGGGRCTSNSQLTQQLGPVDVIVELGLAANDRFSSATVRLPFTEDVGDRLIWGNKKT